MQPGSIDFGKRLNLGDLRLGHLFSGRREIRYHQQRPGEERRPAPQHPLYRPLLSLFAINAHHDVIVVIHHRVGGHIDGEQGSKLLHTLDDPAAAVVEIQARERVLATQEATSVQGRQPLLADRPLHACTERHAPRFPG